MRLVEPTADEGAALSVAEREHLLAEPAQLHTVAFQDLVFGHELGQGTFSRVWYCKHIDRTRPASAWAEYGAKVISSRTVAQRGYLANAEREVAILAQMRHVSVARLVASFRWKEGVYLLVEYAARGDLHTHVRSLGSLSEPSARFVAAEVLCALRYVHGCGFAFGDLKPENVLLTASGHAKLADFGAARPLDGHARARAIVAAGRHALRELRDGDWRAAQHALSLIHI